LYKQDAGYSNYTVEETEVRCALGCNPLLPAVEPYDWEPTPNDNWAATQATRCERYAEGPLVVLDVDGENTVAEQTDDPEQRAAICKDSGREV
jgi:hypothetical protein